jgi:ABC-type nitrate/sulfonate/bicarbonate transport system substrate-binding protein
VRLFLNWLYTASFAGDVLAARDFADGHGVRLNLQVGGEGRDPIRLVRDGDIGVASADEILRAIGVGAPISIIGVLSDSHPAAFAALKSSGIVEPKDFEGKRVGMLPFGATGLIYDALVKKAGVDRSKIREVVVTPDLRPFISGRVNDVQPIFMYDEPVTLEKQGIAFNIVDPRKYGVHFKGQCYFATRNTVAKQPEVLSRALQALIQGWSKAADAPSQAVAALKELSPSLDAPSEVVRLQRALPFFVPTDRRQLLLSDPASWSNMIETLVSTKTIPRAYRPEEFLSLGIVGQAHAAVLG